ncbi:HNH endonuclease [Stenomitos frigidus]|uniref:HNH endonuclease n=1 Tax=Stenomitos frigidus TaxID=1886765 RepID=UPI00329A3477
MGGSDDRSNLVTACYHCNEFKGAKTAATDPEAGQLAPLFQLQTQGWTDQFAWFNGGTYIIGTTLQVERPSLSYGSTTRTWLRHAHCRLSLVGIRPSISHERGVLRLEKIMYVLKSFICKAFSVHKFYATRLLIFPFQYC